MQARPEPQAEEPAEEPEETREPEPVGA